MIDQLLTDLQRRHVRVWADGGRLRYDAPQGALTEAIIADLRVHKGAILEHLRVADASACGPFRSAERHGPALLSFAQERMWLLWKLAPNSPAYNVPFVIKLTGRLDIGTLLDSLQWIPQRHENLRSCFVGGRDGVRQLVHDDCQLDLQILELSGGSRTDREESARRHMREEATRPFDLERASPFAVRLYRLEETVHWILIKLHHIVVDARSISLFLRELACLYTSLRRGAAPSLSAAPIQYSDFAAWQRERLQGVYRDRLLAYWKSRLSADLPPLRLARDRGHARTSELAGGRISFQFRPEVAAGLREVARRQRATMFMVLLSAVRILLYRYTGQADLQIGSPVMCRDHPDTEALIGYFGNTLVLRNPLEPVDTYADVLARERDNALDAYEHQELPFALLVQELVPARALDRNPLFDVMLSFTEGESAVDSFPDLKADVSEVETSTAKVDLLLALEETEGTLAGVIEYSSDVFDGAAAERMAAHLEVLADDVAHRPGDNICANPFLTSQERDLLLRQWNDTGRAVPHLRCLHELFEERAAADPLATAVYFGEKNITYARLNQEANRVAHRLAKLGVQQGDIVAICTRRSPLLVAALLGVLKAGAAYVPIDPLYPPDRMNVILVESRARLLVTERVLATRIPAAETPFILLDAEPVTSPDEEQNLGRRASPHDLSYVLFTSGSTGHPKGVMIEHRNTAALLAWAYSVYDDEDLACVLAGTSVCFDLSIFELFVPLCAGHAIALAENTLGFSSLPIRNRVTLINTVPSVMKALLREEVYRLPDSLRVINLAGERLETSLVDLIHYRARAIRVYDLYGPTEATTYSTFKLRRPGVAPSIGRPIANTRCYVLDPHGAPVPVGVAGELCLAGEGLARGYLHQPDLTSDRFTKPRSPWIEEARLYHTGDLVRYMASGDLEYIGRSDDQLKIRGHRIEPAEVRAALITAAGVEDAVVMGRQGRNGESILVAYIVGDAAWLDARLLKQHLRKLLPEYMIPSRFVPIATLPLNSNGKVDTRRLPDDPDVDRRAARDYVKPQTATQRLVAETWAELLGVDSIGIRDDFFDLGGHSLTAMRATASVNGVLEIDVPLRTIFEYPTVEGFAAEIEIYLAGARAPDVPPLRPQRRDHAPATLLQRHLWHLHHAVLDSSFLNIASSISVRGTLDLQTARNSLLALAERHPILRARFSAEGDLRQVPATDVPLDVTFEDLQGAGGARPTRTLACVYDDLTRPFDIVSGPCTRFAIVRLAPDHHVLVMVLHHIIVDEWSLGLLRRELTACYAALIHDLPLPLPPVLATFADHAAWERECLTNGAFETQMAHWREVLKAPLLQVSLPWRSSASAGPEKIWSYTVAIDTELTTRLAEVAHRASCSLFVALLSALKRLLQHLTGATDIRIATNLAARHRRGVESVVGPLTDTVILRTWLPPGHTPASALQLVRATFVTACGLQGIPFEEIATRLESESNIGRHQLAQVFFSFDEGDANIPPLPGLTAEDASAEQDANFFEQAPHDYDLILYLRSTDRGIRGKIMVKGRIDDGTAGAGVPTIYRELLEELAWTS